MSHADFFLSDSCLEQKLPEQLIDSVGMQSLWVETGNLCFMLNDVFSVQKEDGKEVLLELKCHWLIDLLGSAFPPEYYSCFILERNFWPGGLDKVTRDFMVLLESSRTKLRTLLSRFSRSQWGRGVFSTDIEAFIRACRYFTTGAVLWSLETPRYNLAKWLQEDGSFVFFYNN